MVRPFRIERQEFLFAAHLVLMMATHFATCDFAEFDQVKRWDFEDIVADFDGHLRRPGLAGARQARHLGVGYDAASIMNIEDVHAWATELVPEGPRLGASGPPARSAS